MNILYRIFNSKMTTFFLCFLLALLAGGGALYWQTTQAAAKSDVMYLLPNNPTLVEKNLASADLAGDSDVKIGYTSNWEVISDLANKNQLHALIIHHAALGSVNTKQLRRWFRDGLVVTGIGIPAKDLANLLDMPSLNIWGDEETYRTSAYFYMFSIQIKGTPEDRRKIIANLEQNGADVPANGIQSPATTIVNASTDSLFTQEGKKSFHSFIKKQMQSVSGQGQ